MINVYDIGNEDWIHNGDAVLVPTEVKVKSVAAGNYDLTMTHPMDPEGKWEHLVPGAVLKVWVPEERIENAFAGYAADIYKTTTEAQLRASAEGPTTISYTAWNDHTAYQKGDKVSCPLYWGHKNWICTYWDGASPQSAVPPYASSWWKQVPDSTSGAAVLATLPTGAELYFIQDVDSTWYKMSTYYGLEGYILKSQVTFYKHLSASEVQPRIIKNQLFRITNATVDTKSRKVSVTAQHVSYDLNGIIVQEVAISQAEPAMAIGRIVEGFMIPYAGTIATNLDPEENGTYTDTIKGKTGMYCLLDPDKGIVSTFDAKFTRDNWDLFVMEKETVDRGFRLVYRKNMLGVNWARKSDSLITRIVPVAKNAEGGDLYLPEKWIDSEDIDDYPVIRMEILQVKGQVGKDKGLGDDSVWTESDLLDEMRAKATERYTVDKVDQITEEVTVDFEMLGDTAEHAALKGLENALLYDSVQAEDPRIGLDVQLTVTELEWDPIREKITALKMANVIRKGGKNVTGYNVQQKSISSDKLADDVASGILDQVKDVIPEFASPYEQSMHENTKTQDGYVKKGDGNADKVWGTDSQGNPGWSALPANTKDADGIVTKGSGNGGKVWGTDAQGNPGWQTPSSGVTVEDNLTSTSTTNALSANQGRVLNGKITNLEKNGISSTSVTLTYNVEYIAETDGYIRLMGNSGSINVTVNGMYIAYAQSGEVSTLYIRKGMKLKRVDNNASATAVFFKIE